MLKINDLMLNLFNACIPEYASFKIDEKSVKNVLVLLLYGSCLIELLLLFELLEYLSFISGFEFWGALNFLIYLIIFIEIFYRLVILSRLRELSLCFLRSRILILIFFQVSHTFDLFFTFHIRRFVSWLFSLV